MILFKRAGDLRKWIDNQLPHNKKVGFIPTMGALHDGHISLIKVAKVQNSITVVSIFVNPTQFNDPKDFEKYPVTIENDIHLLEASGCDILFLPSVREIYPDGISERKHYNLGFVETVLDGKFRPGHFQGVCMVVEKLLSIVIPDNLYLGQKDYQQCMVINKLIELMGLKDKINLMICPTLREANGLAMSSRNMRLSADEKEKAGIIYKSLCFIKENKGNKSSAELKQAAEKMLENSGLKTDYIEIADATDLSPVNEWKEHQKTVALAAVFMKEVRLIDNMLLN